MSSIRIALCVLLATSIARSAWAREQSAPSAAALSTQADVPHPMRIRIGGSVLQPALIHVVQPVYPAGATATGTVVLHTVVDTDGTVMRLEGVSGDPVLTTAAMDAVKQWRYRPTKLNGQAVQVDSTISVVFNLDRHGKLKPQPKNP
jgi:TonB family protein